MQKPTPTRQLPAHEAQAKGVLIPYFHPAERDDEPVNYHLTLVKFDREALDKLVLICRKKAAIVCPNPLDNRNGNLDYPVTDKERVGFLRHSAINRTDKNLHQMNGYSNSYDNLLYRIQKKGIDVAARQLDLKLAILRLIQASYPNLSLECEEQIFKAKLAFEAENPNHPEF